MAKKLISAVLALGGAAAAYGFYQNNFLQISRRFVRADIEKPLRLLVLSDLHGKQFGKGSCRLIKNAAALYPDVILFTGDTISSDCKNLGSTLANLKKLCKIAPCFLIPGNHEHRSGRWNEIKQKISDLGVIVLENERWSGAINGVSVNILGLNEKIAISRIDYIKSFFGCLRYPDNSELLKDLQQQDGAKLVLCHFPECFVKSEYCRFNFDLMLSGHAHGGHFRLNDHIAFFAAGQGFLPKFCQGLYGSRPRLFVSRGLGNDSPLPRINNRPEMALITLLPKITHN